MLTIRRTPRARVAVPAMLGSLEGMAALALAHGAAGGGGPEPVSLITFGVLVYAASWVVLRRRDRSGTYRNGGPSQLVSSPSWGGSSSEA